MLHLQGFDRKRAYRYGVCVNKNGNESTDGRVASADCRQLIDFEIVLVVRTSGD